MSGLSGEDLDAIAVAMHLQSSACIHVGPPSDPFNGCEKWAEALAPTVEAIVTRAVNQALTEAADAIEGTCGPTRTDASHGRLDAARILRARTTN